MRNDIRLNIGRGAEKGLDETKQNKTGRNGMECIKYVHITLHICMCIDEE